MKKTLLPGIVGWCMGIVLAFDASACIGSDCKPCPDGFSVTKKCCKGSDKNECVILNDVIEDCGVGQWSEYSKSIPVISNECCTDATENNCRFINHYKGFCGIGEFKEYPYSPVKKCCKDDGENNCVTIRAKRKCGKYQLEEYPLHKGDCCNPDFSKCTGHITDCPRCL